MVVTPEQQLVMRLAVVMARLFAERKIESPAHLSLPGGVLSFVCDPVMPGDGVLILVPRVNLHLHSLCDSLIVRNSDNKNM